MFIIITVKKNRTKLNLTPKRRKRRKLIQNRRMMISQASDASLQFKLQIQNNIIIPKAEKRKALLLRMN